MPTHRELEAAIERAGDAGDADAVRELGAHLKAMSSPDAAPVKRDDSKWRGFKLGAIKPTDNLARAAYSILPDGVTKALRTVDDTVGLDQPEQNVRERANNTRKGWQGVGSFIGTLPLDALPGGWVAQGAAGGALTTDANDLEGIGTDAALGTLGSGVATGVTRSVGKFASPIIRPAVKALRDRGIPLTPGQIAGGGWQKLEDAATSVFGLGNMIEKARGRGIAAFNRAAFDDALEPLGVKLPDGLSGHKAAAFTKDLFKRTYDTVLGNMVVPNDQQLGQGLNKLVADASAIPGDMSRTFMSFVGKHVAPYFQNGSMSGDAFKAIDRTIRKEAVRYGKSTVGAEQAYGDLLNGLRGEMRDAAKRGSGKEMADLLDATDSAYANYVPIRNAASKTDDGTFLPGGLDVSVRAADRSAGKGAKAAGRARMQPLSSAAREVLPSNVGDSGTQRRLVAQIATTGGGLGAGAFVGLSPKVLAAMPLMAAAYTKPGQKVATSLLTGRQSPAARKLREAMFGAGRYLAAPAGVVPPLLARQDQ